MGYSLDLAKITSLNSLVSLSLQHYSSQNFFALAVAISPTKLLPIGTRKKNFTSQSRLQPLKMMKTLGKQPSDSIFY